MATENVDLALLPTAKPPTEPEKTTCKNDMASGGPGREKFEFETATLEESVPFVNGNNFSREISQGSQGYGINELNGNSTAGTGQAI